MNKRQIFNDYLNDFFIETGTNLGEGIDYALKYNFKNIISIELSDLYYKKCLTKFKRNDNVTLYLGDSSKLLFNIIKDIKCNITFWLDGHFSGGSTAKGPKISPLIEELQIIKKHQLNTHTILIDDISSWDTKFKYQHGFDIDDIYSLLRTINKDYSISAKQNVLIVNT